MALRGALAAQMTLRRHKSTRPQAFAALAMFTRETQRNAQGKSHEQFAEA